MSPDTLLALAVYAFVASVTPGPNNFMVLASGANFGLVRTLPQVFGITLGYGFLLLAVGLGLGALLSAVPALHLGLKIGGALYLLYLAWRIAMARSMGGEAEARPPNFLEAAGFQWINPKGWVVALSAMAVYADPAHPFLTVVIVAGVFVVVATPAVLVWAGCGVALRGFLSDPIRLKWFNIAMGAALAATLWPMLR
ncbi:MAG TPA: LysE family translocator [Azospirillaceae bacterium]|nr:LysE family translocator [Azospirillaceae bacterium]